MPVQKTHTSTTEPLVSYTIFPDTSAQSCKEFIDVPWHELCAKIHDAPTFISKRHCSLISMASYGDSRSDKGALRHAGNVRQIFGVEIDYDGEEIQPEEGARRLQAAGLIAIIYTSPSHIDGAPRWRALLPLSEPAEPSKRALYAARANRALGGIATGESFTLSQSFYIGRVRGATYRTIETHGRCVDLAADLEPQYFARHGEPTMARDTRNDDELRAAFIDGEGRYEAMLKLSSRWAARGMAVDDIMAALHGLMDQCRTSLNAQGIDLRSRIEPMAVSAVQKFGGKPMAWSVPEPPAEEIPPVEAYVEEADAEPVHELPGKSAPEIKSEAIDWTALDGQEPPPREWRIDHWMGHGPMLLAGAGGIGKSLLAQTMATALALGRYYVDTIPEPQTVLMWSCEDDRDEIWRRQHAICRFFGVPMRELAGRLIIEPRLGRSNALFGLAYGQPVWTGLREELVQQVNDYRATVLFLDNIGQVYGGNENDRHHVTTFVNGLCGITSWALSTVFLGHPAKVNGSEFSGSTAWENAVRMRWFLGTTLPDQPETATAEDGVRYLAKRKTNYSTKDWRRLTYLDGALIPEQQRPGCAYASQARAEDARRCVLSALRKLVERSIRTTGARNSPDFLPRKMLEMKLAEDYTQRELVEAMNALLMEQRIANGKVGTYANRTPMTGLVEVEPERTK